MTGLPSHWSKTPAPDELQLLGQRWVESMASAILCVPSAIVPIETVILINPAHADVARIKRQRPLPFLFDARMFK